MQAAVGFRFEEVYRNTQLKQERGIQQEAIREEVFLVFAGRQSSVSYLGATALGGAAASVGGVGGLGPSTSKPPAFLDVNAKSSEETDDIVVEAPADPTDKSAKETTASTIGDMPSVPPPDRAEDEETASSSSQTKSAADGVAKPIIETGIGAAALGLGGVGGLGKSNSEPDMAGEEASGSGRVLPMGSISATPAQVSRALKVSQLNTHPL